MTSPPPAVAAELCDLVARGERLIDRYPGREAWSAALARFRQSHPPLSPAPPQALPARALLPHGKGAPRRPARVCIATPDIVGPIRNGGVGTAYASLARCLAGAGQEVTILYTMSNACEVGSLDSWRDAYAAEGIRFVPLPDPSGAHLHARMAYQAWQWLKEHDFDVVHFPEMGGVGSSAVMGKRLGLGLAGTTLCVGVHSPTLWHELENRRPLSELDELERDHLERQSVALADAVICPTQYLLGWLDAWGWRTPEASYVWPYVLHVPARPTLGAARHIEEVAFFGRLETRKGIELFCDAVDRMECDGRLGGSALTLLGKVGKAGDGDALAYVRARASAWRREVRAMTELSSAEALDYLASRPVLAVMPSLADNAPLVVLECMGTGIPFVTTAVGGIPEMIAAGDAADALVPPDPAALAAKIGDLLGRGARPVAPAIPFEATREGWVAWHEERAAARDLLRPAAAPPDPPAPKERPLVSVCVATRDRPHLLEHALESLRCQSYAPFELLLVDDGSESEAARAALDALEPEFRERGWTILREARRFPAGARNAAAAAARGRYLFFMDDDNVALPRELETFVEAAEHSGDPLLTCLMDDFEGEGPATPETRRRAMWRPAGGALPLGAITNSFGDANMLVRRELFLAMGGYDEDRDAAFVEDWIFYSRAALRGFPATMLPEVLYLYRRGTHGHGQRTPLSRKAARAALPYLDVLPPPLGLAFLYASGAARLVEQLRHDVAPASMFALAERFRLARPGLLLGPADAALVEPVGDATVEAAADGILIRASGPDPRVRLPAVPHLGAAPFIARIELTVPVASWIQLFWPSADGIEYLEARSSLVPVAAGRNLRYLEVPAFEPGRCLRFDPGHVPGDYRVHSLELRSPALVLDPWTEPGGQAATPGGDGAATPAGRRAVDELLRSEAELLRRLAAGRIREKEVEAMRGEVEATARELQELRASWSWRITGPLRRLAALVLRRP